MQGGTPEFSEALSLHKSGLIDDARAAYRQVLVLIPAHSDALHNLGIIEFSVGESGVGTSLFRRAVQCELERAIFWVSLARALTLDDVEADGPEIFFSVCLADIPEKNGSSSLLGEVEAAIESASVDLLASRLADGRFSDVMRQASKLILRFPANDFFLKSLGLSFYQLGSVDEALKVLERARNINPCDFESSLNFGATLFNSNLNGRALLMFEAALCLKPDSEIANGNRGRAIMLQAREHESATSFERALRLASESSEFLLDFGSVLRVLGRIEEAKNVLGRLVARQPDNFSGFIGLGLVLKNMGRAEVAISALRHSVAIAPDKSDAYGFIATIISDAAANDADRDLAKKWFNSAIVLNPTDAETMSNYGVALQKRGRRSEGRVALERATSLSPTYPDSLNNLGVLLQDLGDDENANENYRRAVVLRPDYFQAISNIGSVLWRSNEGDAALRMFDRSLQVSPLYFPAGHNRCKTLHGMLQIDEALAGYQRLVVQVPHDPEVYWHHSLALLAKGDFAPGWRMFEFRWWSEQRSFLGKRGPLETLWTANTKLGGKKLVVYAEQGLGDTLQFCRYSRVLVERGANVVTSVPYSMLRLLRAQVGFGEVIGPDDAPPVFDLHCPMMSLPLAFGTTLETIPFGREAYLQALPADVERWRARLSTEFNRTSAGRGRFRVGVVWSGGFRADQAQPWATTERRNVPLGLFAEALDIPQIDFVSLQKGDPAESEVRGREGEYWRRGRLLNVVAELKDFADTAGLIANLDLVISVDTSTAHLSAAMGKPTWILNRYDTCWRWLLDRDDSPWYPAVRLYRQSKGRDWRPVLERVKRDLQDLAGR